MFITNVANYIFKISVLIIVASMIPSISPRIMGLDERANSNLSVFWHEHLKMWTIAGPQYCAEAGGTFGLRGPPGQAGLGLAARLCLISLCSRLKRMGARAAARRRGDFSTALCTPMCESPSVN